MIRQKDLKVGLRVSFNDPLLGAGTITHVRKKVVMLKLDDGTVSEVSPKELTMGDQRKIHKIYILLLHYSEFKVTLVAMTRDGEEITRITDESLNRAKYRIGIGSSEKSQLYDFKYPSGYKLVFIQNFHHPVLRSILKNHREKNEGNIYVYREPIMDPLKLYE